MTTENANNDPVLDALREILAADWSKVGPDLTTVRDSFLYVRLPACGWHVSMDVVDPRRALRLAWDGLDVVYMEDWTAEQAAVVDQIRDRLIRARQAESIALGSKSISVLVKIGDILKTKRTSVETP